VRALTIGDQRLADEEPCYVVAELGANHGGHLPTALQMIKIAIQCGVSACKLQKRENATLYSRALLDQPYDHEHSFGSTYGTHRQALEFGEREYQACRGVAKAHGKALFATAFDEASADFLMALGLPAIKIASGGLTDGTLLRYVSTLGVPILLSTGGGTFAAVDRAVNTLTAGRSPFALLHCTAAYPVLDYTELNLRAIVTMRERYPDTVIGWSGHVSGIAMPLIAYAYGARLVEMHFTLNRAMKGTDHAFSLEPAGLRKLCRDLDRACQATGDGIKRLYESERKPLSKMRRVQTAEGLRITGALDVESRILHALRAGTPFLGH